MKKSNERKFNLKSSLLLLLLTAVLLIVSSYAWFTSNQTVTVSSLNVNVEAKNGLQISADGTNWKSIIQNSDLTSVHSTTYTSSVNQIPSVLEPVSTAGSIDTTTGFMDMFYGVVGDRDDGQLTLSSTKETELEGSTGKFISFDLFFRVNANTQIYLSTNSNVTYADANSRGMENAARIAFLNQGTVSAGASISEIQGLKGATTSFIWEPNYDVHTAAGVANAYDVYGLSIAQTGTDPLPYHGIKAEIPEATEVLLGHANSANHSTLFDLVTPTYLTIKDFASNTQVFTLQSGITKMRIYMWIEGQDVDCENTASGSNIQYNLQLTVNP